MGVSDRKAREFNRREREILDAAFELFMEKGVDPVTIDMIAERAEVGKGTIYKHFCSKSEIFLQLSMRHDRAIQEKMLEIDPGLPVLVQFRQLIRLFWDFSMVDLRAYSIFRGCEKLLLVSDLCPETRESVTCVLSVYRDFVEGIFQRAVTEQIFKDAPVEYFSRVFRAAMLGTVDQVAAGFLESSEELYEFLEDTIIKGFMR